MPERGRARGEALGRHRDLCPAAVVERDDHCHGRVAGRQIAGLVHEPQQLGIDVVALADDEHVIAQRDIYQRRLDTMASILTQWSGVEVPLPSGGTDAMAISGFIDRVERDADGKVQSVHGTVQDITEQALAVDGAMQAQDAKAQERQARLDSLSEREREVMHWLLQGLRNKQTADRLGISEVTVKVHRHRMMEKMAAGSLPELIAMLDRLGVPRTDPGMSQGPEGG